MYKLLIKAVLQKFDFVLMRNHVGFAPEWTPVHRNKIGLLEILIKLELCCGEFKFLQIGANDGISADPLTALIRKYKLNGIMIEAIPDVFKRLLKNCDDVKKYIDFENVAITVEGSKGLMPFYFFATNDQEEQHNLSRFSSTSKAKLELVQSNSGIDADITVVDVPYESVSHYINRHKIDKLNLLVTDVEGMDIDIVTEFIKCKVFPNIIYAEILDQPASKCLKLFELLVNSGYSIGGNISDLVAYRMHDELGVTGVNELVIADSRSE